MNHAIFLVKLITNPVHLSYNAHHTIELGVQFAGATHKNFKNELTLILWGYHRDDFLKYYKIQDYLVVEGILTVKDYKTDETKLKIIAKRIYPFLLY
uniref:Uncharacterized protein n=1 Tax=Protohalopteris sp. TaxID=2843287 RepID=A0A8F0F7P3_9PHAE|nr:hypothetical protein [Protohalopteris sp.]